MHDVLLAIDLLDDFRHEDGATLLESVRERAGGMHATIEAARAGGRPIVYANDHHGIWDGDRDRLVRAALEADGGDLLRPLVPEPDDRLIIKPRYSAFDLTPLELLLAELDAERLILLGTTTEMCVTQTAIDARERDIKVSVVTDACACIDREMERIALGYLEGVAGVQLARAPFF
jgi:nicotinamidase-related amidase